MEMSFRYAEGSSFPRSASSFRDTDDMIHGPTESHGRLGGRAPVIDGKPERSKTCMPPRDRNFGGWQPRVYLVPKLL